MSSGVLIRCIIHSDFNHEPGDVVLSSGSAETLKNARKHLKRQKKNPAATEPQTSAAAADPAAGAVAAVAAAPRS